MCRHGESVLPFCAGCVLQEPHHEVGRTPTAPQDSAGHRDAASGADPAAAPALPQVPLLLFHVYVPSFQ